MGHTVVISGLAFVEDELEAERMALCGQRYEHQAGWQALRSVHVPSGLMSGGRRVKVERPRALCDRGAQQNLPLLESLNARALEVGVAGDAATVFALGAADSQLIYLAGRDSQSTW